ncbi:MAG TPA: hypothetical protein PLZ57_08070 [Pseudobdellovibrionaceae bacterium]|nr:hypothetical protein [Pseudobdellovibrionaceae bacterium]
MSLDQEPQPRPQTDEVEPRSQREASARGDQRHLATREAPRREASDLDATSFEALKLFVILVSLTAAMALLVHWLF